MLLLRLLVVVFLSLGATVGLLWMVGVVVIALLLAAVRSRGGRAYI